MRLGLWVLYPCLIFLWFPRTQCSGMKKNCYNAPTNIKRTSTNDGLHPGLVAMVLSFFEFAVYFHGYVLTFIGYTLLYIHPFHPFHLQTLRTVPCLCGEEPF